MSNYTRLRWMLLFVGIAICAPARPALAQENKASAPASPDMKWAVKIPLRDGVSLNATVFQPHGQKEPLPVVLTLTPYIGDSYTDRAMYFAQHGYVFALVDVRGRGNSGGTFEPFVNDAKDGFCRRVSAGCTGGR